MMTLAIVLVVVAVLAGLFGFGISNTINQIAKFIFIALIIFILIALFYGYNYFRPTPVPSSLPTENETPILIPAENLETPPISEVYNKEKNEDVEALKINQE